MLSIYQFFTSNFILQIHHSSTFHIFLNLTNTFRKKKTSFPKCPKITLNFTQNRQTVVNDIRDSALLETWRYWQKGRVKRRQINHVFVRICTFKRRKNLLIHAYKTGSWYLLGGSLKNYFEHPVIYARVPYPPPFPTTPCAEPSAPPASKFSATVRTYCHTAQLGVKSAQRHLQTRSTYSSFSRNVRKKLKLS